MFVFWQLPLLLKEEQVLQVKLCRILFFLFYEEVKGAWVRFPDHAIRLSTNIKCNMLSVFVSIGVMLVIYLAYLFKWYYSLILTVNNIPLEGCTCKQAHIAYGIIIAILVFIVIALLVFICRRERGKHSLKGMLSGNRIVGPTTILQVNIICIVDGDVMLLLSMLLLLLLLLLLL